MNQNNRLKNAALIFVSATLFVGVAFYLVISSSQAAVKTLTSNGDWESGTLVNTESNTKLGDLKLSPEGIWGPRNLHSPLNTLSTGTTFASDGSYIYVMRGSGSNEFWRYDPVTDSWDVLADLPFSPYYGSDLSVLDGYVYAIFGMYQNVFARYSIADNTWENLADYPELMYEGASVETDGTYIYALRGNNSTEFYRYDVLTDAWSVLDSTPATIRNAGDLTYIGGYLYTARGANTNTFYRYDISGDTWTTRANIPGTINDRIETTTDGTYVYVPRAGNTTTFYRYDPSGNSWTTLSDTPDTVRYSGGPVYLSDDGKIYFFRSNGQRHVWRYDIGLDEFEGPSDPPAYFATGADLVYYGGYLFAPRGANQTTLYRYDLASNTWDTRADAPGSFNDDVKGVAAGSYLYFYRGSNTTDFYRYDPSGNSWSNMAATDSNVRFGGTLAYPGSGDYIYGTRGTTTDTFWRYSISGDSWDDAGVADLPTDAEASYGARLISDGTDVYYFPGIGIKRFFKYSVSGDNWTELTAIPFSPYYGSDISFDGTDTFYAIAGYYEKEFWAYTISTDTWRQLPSISGYLAQENGPYNGGSIEYDGSGSFYIIRGNNISDMTSFTPSSTNYPTSGTWTSGAIDLTYVASWTSLIASTTTPSDSSITFETRSSVDNVNWSSWQSASGGTISSPARQYLQVRATLNASTDQASTPSLHSISISYTGDEVAPTNPNTIVALSQEIGGTALSDGGTYNYIHPYFSWSGGSDSETAIDGYYVYFGTNNSADPETAGSYQTTTDYLVTTDMGTGTYYLRIQTKDIVGNVSSAVTLFTYDYNGISPSLTVTATSTGDFSGTTTDTNISNNEIKLTSQAGFWDQSRLSTTPSTMQYGAKTSAYVASSNKMYVFRGANVSTFYEYDVDTDTWSTLSNAPGNVRIGGGVVEGPSGYLFGMGGNNTSAFWRYEIATDTWSDGDAADMPGDVYYGGSLVYDGSRYIYVMGGNNSDSFWRYDTQSDSWDTLADVDFGAPNEAVNNYVHYGADIVYDGNGFIYATQGNWRSGFAVYDIVGDEWTPLDSVPVLVNSGSALEYDQSSNALYLTGSASDDAFYKYDLSTTMWTSLTAPPIPFNYGAELQQIGDYLYAIRGGNTNSFYRYHIARDVWEQPTRNIFSSEYQGTSYQNVNYGADIVRDSSGYLYMMRGYYSDDFVRYDPVSGESITLTNLPAGTYNGGSLEYVDTSEEIFFIPGAYLQKFFVYDIATDTWSELSNDPPPMNTNYGSSMAYDGSRYIYLAPGGNTTNFYRYDTQASAGSRWTQMASEPGNQHYGAELAYSGGYIYILRGGNVSNNPFYRYDTSSDTWSDGAVADLSIDVYNDGFLVDGGDGYLYAARGDNDVNWYRYSISGDTWGQLTDVPANVYVGGSGASDGSHRIYVLPGSGSNTYADGLYSYVQQTSTTSFVKSGAYASGSHDFGSVYQWANLVVTFDEPSNTSLTVQTRTSDDDSTWSSWSDATEEKVVGSEHTYKINSPTEQYFQIKFALTSSDNIYSPVVSDYTVHYYQDLVAPSNPSAVGFLGYSDDSETTAISTATWYGYETPYFTWPAENEVNGATDTNGSGVAGYYVYFGEDNLADPETDGVLQSTNNFTASSLTSDTTYYLRLKTVDAAGNVSASTVDAFTYQFDNSGADGPTDVTADPSGYTANDSFTMSWNAVVSGSGSPITEYCYKTSAESGTWSTDQCSALTSVTNVPPYRTGVNTFAVRTKDAAGNYSSYVTVSYYYSATAPSPPQNLTVTPSTNTVNEFAFSWDAPSNFSGDVNKILYYYSVNTLPTEFSAVETDENSLETGPFATVPGENTFYIVAKDEAGNIDYNLYASTTFTANTSAPGIPLAIEIADVSVKTTESWKIALSWEAPLSLGSGVDQYQVWRSIDGETYELQATARGISYVDTELVQQTYWYQIKACDSTNNCGSFSDDVTLYPDGRYTAPADLVAEPTVANISTRRAIVNWSTDRTCDSKIAYGDEPGNYFDEEVSNSDHVTAHTLTLNNLDPGTTYYYVTKWTDEDGNTGVSNEYMFVTEPAPSVSSVAASNVSISSALIRFTVKNAVSASLLYGKTISYGGSDQIFTSTDESTYTLQLTNLEDNTTYHYQLELEDSEGNKYNYEDHVFTTLPRPRVSEVQLQQVSGTAQPTVLVTWQSNTAISSIVTYTPVTNTSLSKDEVDLELQEGEHRMIIRGLLPQTQYSLTVKGVDKLGNEAVSDPVPFTTASDTRPPQLTNLQVEASTVRNSDSGNTSAQLIVTWDSDELGTSQVEYAEGTGTTYTARTQEDDNLNGNHVVLISNLSPSNVYHLRAISRDSAGNIGYSGDVVTITPKAENSALDLVLSNLADIFGFLNTGGF